MREESLHRPPRLTLIGDQLKRAGGNEYRAIGARQIERFHLLLMQNRCKHELRSPFATDRQHLRGIVNAVDVDRQLKKIEQDSSRAAAYIQHRLSKFANDFKIEMPVAPIGRIAAPPVPRGRLHSVIFVIRFRHG